METKTGIYTIVNFRETFIVMSKKTYTFQPEGATSCKVTVTLTGLARIPQTHVSLATEIPQGLLEISLSFVVWDDT